MADDAKSNPKSGIPAWQQQASEQPTSEIGSEISTDSTDETANQPNTEETVTLDQARRFLQEPEVQSSSDDKKIEFLKSKGLDDAQINELLTETRNQGAEDQTTATQMETTPVPTVSAAQANAPTSNTSAPPVDSPPIITYPEFLTKPQRPPPLITPSRLANILTVSGSVLALLYGTARYVVNPMVENLNDSRADYYNHVNGHLDELVSKLEGVVSEVPYKAGGTVVLRSKGDGTIDDNESTASDPTELFHRDMGTQTSPQAFPSPGPGASSPTSDKPVDAQARRLAAIRSSLRELSDTYTKRTENTEQLTGVVREMHDELHKVAYPPAPEYSGIQGGGFGRWGAEPDDEYKKTKDAIRSVKGLFLSTRSFRSFPTVLGSSAPASAPMTG